jgi:extracellular factor (EF) 3-hydroxypalmitic acid methyl ester biosynthesis protein
MDLSKTANASSKLIETVEQFTELEESGFDDEHSAYHAVVSLVHQLCMNIGHAEKLGHNRTDIERILEPVWELHSRSPFFRRMQSWPRGYPGDYETIEYLCECESKARPGTVGYFIDQYGVTCNMAQQHRNKLTWQAAKVLQTSLESAEESHVLSIACGGSRDLRSIQSLLQAAPVQLFLNDIDADALGKHSSSSRREATSYSRQRIFSGAHVQETGTIRPYCYRRSFRLLERQTDQMASRKTI